MTQQKIMVLLIALVAGFAHAGETETEKRETASAPVMDPMLTRGSQEQTQQPESAREQIRKVRVGHSSIMERP